MYGSGAVLLIQPHCGFKSYCTDLMVMQMEHVVDPRWTGKQNGMLANSTVEQDADDDNNNDNNNNHDDHDSKLKAMDPCLIVLVQCLLAFDSEATPDFPKLIQNYRNKLRVNLDNYDFQSQGPTKD